MPQINALQMECHVCIALPDELIPMVRHMDFRPLRENEVYQRIGIFTRRLKLIKDSCDHLKEVLCTFRQKSPSIMENALIRFGAELPDEIQNMKEQWLYLLRSTHTLEQALDSFSQCIEKIYISEDFEELFLHRDEWLYMLEVCHSVEGSLQRITDIASENVIGLEMNDLICYLDSYRMSLFTFAHEIQVIISFLNPVEPDCKSSAVFYCRISPLEALRNIFGIDASRDSDRGSFEELSEARKTNPKNHETADTVTLMDPGNDSSVLQPEDTVSKVQFHALAPSVINKNDFTMVKILMINDGDLQRLEQIKKSMNTDLVQNESSVMFAPQGAEYTIVLSSQDISIENPRETIKWNGTYACCDFFIFLPEDYKKSAVRLQARVYKNDIAQVDLKLIVKVKADSNQSLQDIAVEQHRIMTAFLSYASQDREKVAQRIQGMLAIMPKLDIFWDVVSLRRGEYWETRLYDEIRKRDIFYLFWSNNARSSEWVGKELSFAIENKGIDFIEPIPLEDPAECPPPEELTGRHFNDWTLRYMSHRTSP